jgi:hypothetical protein
MTPQTTAGATFGLGVLSSAIGGYGKYEQGQQEKAAADYNANIAIEDASAKAVVNAEQSAEIRGKQASGYAGAGVDIASGSPLLIMAATAARKAQQGEQIVQAGAEESTIDRYYGKIAAFGGTLSGVGSFLSGVSSAASQYSVATAKPKVP